MLRAPNYTTAEFVCHSARICASVRVAKNENDANRTRATLLGRLKNFDDHASWQEFFDIYWPLVYGFARKAGLTDAEAQDAVAETFAVVAQKMPDFKYDPAIGTFKAWLLTLTRWRIADQFRKRGPLAIHSPPGDTARTATIDRIPDEKNPGLDALWDADWQKTLYAAALDHVRQQVDPKQFQIFDFYVKHEWPPEKVAKTFSVTVNQVYIAKTRVLDKLQSEVRRLERDVT
jgi:RNA polymerase sigma-70 factor (ECF subfamily)